MTKDDILINCWGESIEKNGVIAKRYLSYIVGKKQLTAIKKYYQENLNQFDYAEVTLDQESNEITLDFHSNEDEEIIRTTWRKSIFYNLIADIEA